MNWHPREWDWIPHLVTCYALLLGAWLAIGAGMFFFAGCDPVEFCSSPPLGKVVLARVLQVIALGFIPGLGIAATIRVALNEQRKREEAQT